MTSTRYSLIRARIPLREADDLLLTAILRHREPERFDEARAEAIEHLADVASELGYRLEPVESLALACRAEVAKAFEEGMR